MPDLEAAAAHPAPVVCDATVASPLRLRPLEHGCDVALHSATKILSGHDDVLAGVAVARDPELRDRLHQTRRLAGIVAPADTAWLVLRGLETLEARLDRQEASARTLVERLQAHPAVTTVRYPGFSFLVSFDVADGEAAGRVERAVRTIVNATSLGGHPLQARGAPSVGGQPDPDRAAAPLGRPRGPRLRCGQTSSRRSRRPNHVRVSVRRVWCSCTGTMMTERRQARTRQERLDR